MIPLARVDLVNAVLLPGYSDIHSMTLRPRSHDTADDPRYSQPVTLVYDPEMSVVHVTVGADAYIIPTVNVRFMAMPRPASASPSTHAPVTAERLEQSDESPTVPASRRPTQTTDEAATARAEGARRRRVDSR